MAKLIITVEADDPSDLQWLYDRLQGAVEDVIEENRSRFDGPVDSSIEWGD